MSGGITSGILWLGLTLTSVAFSQTSAAPSGSEFFENRIRPVLIRHCYECHSGASAQVKGGLRVDSRDAIRQGGDTGPAVVPGNLPDSLLLEALRHETLQMPPKLRLPEQVIADFETWIKEGAPDPRDKAPTAEEAAELAWTLVFDERRKWWSLQPPQPVTPPEIADPRWSAEPVDRFIRQALDQAELTPAAPADPVILARRLAFVLTGLPPEPAQTQAYLAASAQNPELALEHYIDELLNSPHFGERFARHWMDVVRYTDTYGYEWDNPAKGSWEYRDYLIRAFNQDVGFDHMIREQLAGDLLPEPRIDAAHGINESLIGPMFLHMGEHRHGDSLEFNGIHQEMVNNKIDAFSKAFLATTVACARCHDHKLDAVSQQDYYALAGVFMTPRWTSRVLDTPDKYATEIADLKRLRESIRQTLASRWQQSLSQLTPTRLRELVQQKLADAKPGIEDVAYPLVRLASTTTDAEIVQHWNTLKQEWHTQREQRQAGNQANFQVVTDFHEPGWPAGWVTEGAGLEHGYVADGMPLIALEGEQGVQRLLPRGYHSHALSSKLPGALRSPPEDLVAGSQFSLQLAGGEWAGHLVIPQNAFQTESVTFLNRPQPAWTTFGDRPLINGVTRVLVEVDTSSLNPNFPPRTGKGTAENMRLPDNDPGYDKRSWFSVTGIATHNAGGVPADTLDTFAALYEQSAPETADQAWHTLQQWFASSVGRWSRGESTAEDLPRLNWLLSQGLLPNQLTDDAALAELVREYRTVEARIGFPRTANSCDERALSPVNYRLNVRGNPDVEGPAVPHDFLSAFAGQNQVAGSPGSGRLELARYLSSPDNPQTARVYVNRVWYWVFGAGLVATPDDFGKLGERPSHPELLDWLAREFVREGWSTKTLVRRLVLSQTFRQSGEVVPRARELDPQNRLLHHYPTRRLEAEAIRDSLLAVSGRLDPALYGTPINAPRTKEDASKRLFSGPLNGNGRRSLYTLMSIMDPPKFLVGFNLPDLKLPTGRRDQTNVPAQALILLNDPLVAHLAEQWAAKLVQDGLTEPGTRVRSMFLTALGREPSAPELTRWTAAVSDFSSGNPLMQDQAAWTALAHALFNTKEFLYYR